MIPGSANPLLLVQQDTGYKVERSLRFNSSDSAYLSRTPASAGNRKTWTWAGWVKRSGLSSTQRIFSSSNSGNTEGFYCELVSGDTLSLYDYSNPTIFWQKTTSQVFRDASAWFHLQVAFDSTNATAGDRVKIYVNGVLVTVFGTSTNPSLNYDSYWNAARVHAIGRTGDANAGYFSGYLADIHFIDGQALDTSSFTEVSATTGQLVPKAYSGSFGTNGFWLKFSDNSAATATTLGKDYSGNSNNFTPNNFQVVSVDQTAGVQSGITSAPINGSPYGNPTQWFDGNLATSAGVDGGSSNTTPRKWTFNTPIPYSSSVRIRISTNELNMGYHFNNVNTGLPNNGSTPTYYTVATGSGTISNLGVYNSNGSGQGTIHISAIEVDGALLIATPPQGNDSLVDTPTSYGTGNSGGDVRGNFCTWNPLDNGSVTLSNGNLDGSATVAWKNVRGTIAFPSSGKWYYEVTPGGSALLGVGIAAANKNLTDQSTGTFVTYNEDGRFYKDGSINASGKATYTSGDVIGVAFDCDTNSVTFYKNNVSQGSVTPTTGVSYFPFVQIYNSSLSANWGQRAFAYTAPSGFKALCDTNLPAPVVAKSSDYFQTVLYTGNGTARSITGLNFNPDFVWIKQRNSAVADFWHCLFDSVRGVGKILYSNTTTAEETKTTSLTSFDNTGFSLGTDGQGAGVNINTGTYVAWAWDAGTATASNPDGSITSSVRANASAGFSIVTYTGNGNTGTGASASSIGHGLGVAPQLIIVKRRSEADSWGVYHYTQGANAYGFLNTTDAWQTGSFVFSNAPTSSLFYVTRNGTAMSNNNGSTYVAYCFAPVAGYSSFGSYTGNGSADGPFVYTGHRSRWLMVKASSSAGNWVIFDTARNTYNVVGNLLLADVSDSEYSVANLVDIYSNGFKMRDAHGTRNASGVTYIYASFAESPFQYARAR